MLPVLVCYSIAIASSEVCYVVSGAQRTELNGKYCPDSSAPRQGRGWTRPHRQIDGPGTLEYHEERHWFLTERYGRMLFKSDSTSLEPPASAWERSLGGGKTEPALALSVTPSWQMKGEL